MNEIVDRYKAWLKNNITDLENKYKRNKVG